MDNASKKLSHVFGKLSLTNKLLNGLGGVEIHKITVNNRSKHMKIQMRHTAVVNESLFQELREQLGAQMPDVTDIDIQMRYLLEEQDQTRRLESCRDNILYMIDSESRVCRRLLSEAEWELSGGFLLIKLKSVGAFILTGKGIDVKIQKYMESRFDEQIRVRFEDGKKTARINTDIVQENTHAHSMQGIGQYADDNQHSKMNDISENTTAMFNPANTEFASATTEYPSATAAPPAQYKSSYNGKPRSSYKKMKLSNKLVPDGRKLSEPLERDTELTVEGVVIESELRETKAGRYLVSFDMTDGTDSLSVKFFVKPSEYSDEYKQLIKKGKAVIVKGKIQYDEYAKELNMMASAIGAGNLEEKRMDNAAKKRVELHLHTQMSAMDGVSSAASYVDRAAKWGHKAIAITDHGGVQAFPDAMKAAKGTGVKILYGVEAYLVDDLGAIVQSPGDRSLDGSYVVFDLETTGLKPEKDKIIEIGAVRLENGEITGRYSTFVDPSIEIPEEITELTGITTEMVEGAPGIREVLAGFLDFIGECSDMPVLVAHNAPFDVGFVTQAARELELVSSVLSGCAVLDTLALSRVLYPELSKHKLNIVAKHLGIRLDNHHRAVDDAEATAQILLHSVEAVKKGGAVSLRDVNLISSSDRDKAKLPYAHAVIFARNEVGLKNMYKLISEAHINYFYKRPRIPKSEYIKYREGLIIGTACEAGELFRAVRDNKPDEFISELADFYDYFEIQPIGNNMYLYREGKVGSVQELQDINKKIVKLGEQYGKPVVATCDAHFLEPEDEVYRRIIMAGEGYKDADNQAPLFYRTTDEMLAEFEYLGTEKAEEVVIHNTNFIADMIDDIKPIPDGTFAPKIDGAEQTLTDIAMKKAMELYGDPLPEIVADRLERELNSINKNGFAVLYVIAEKLVSKSMADGYLVGSRGSVGSSLAATMAGITEVNPLPPHYLCPSCRYSDFSSTEANGFGRGSGFDMPDRDCPVCGTALGKDGHNIPFETFLGFDGDKEPDIDLNFSGEYQARAHAYTEELFGEGYVFKAGTIGTLADKTAYGYVKKYLEERGIEARSAEINRLKAGCTGVRKSTGQHPGGLMIIPAGHSIYEFSPIQRPANDTSSNITTTHFDYNAIKGRLLKLDILGHDVPTIIRMLYDITGVDPITVPLSDPRVMSLFTSPNEMGVTAEEINCGTGSLGLPEFGTSFVRQMLLDTQPTVFSDLVRISGLSHGTDVWLNNAQELVRSKTATLREIIPGRDDIMVYLISLGVEKLTAFKIMEDVRLKGHDVSDEQVQIMEEAGVPEWYIESCRKIKYLFPKGHAVAYVTMTVRIAYYKLYHPYSFYAASFSVKAEDFDYDVMCRGREIAMEAAKALTSLGKEATAKDKNSLTILELVLEMYARGLRFVPLDLYKAEVSRFLVTDDGLMPPLCSVSGLGVSVAKNIVEAREEGEFFTVDDFRARTKTNKTVIELLKKHGILNGIPDTNQLSLF